MIRAAKFGGGIREREKLGSVNPRGRGGAVEEGHVILDRCAVAAFLEIGTPAANCTRE